MNNQEWFRNTTWTEKDRDDFFNHLCRCRKTNRAQFLKIQAYHLYQTNAFNEILASLELVNIALTEYPERIYLAELLEQKANCLNKLGSLDEAEDSFMSAITAMRTVPNVKPNVPFSFGLFLIEHRINRLNKEILMILDEFVDVTNGLVFPITEYYFYGIKAIILFREGYYEKAKPFASKAIIALEKQYSGISRHPKFGLVLDQKGEFQNELEKIAQ